MWLCVFIYGARKKLYLQEENPVQTKSNHCWNKFKREKLLEVHPKKKLNTLFFIYNQVYKQITLGA